MDEIDKIESMEVMIKFLAAEAAKSIAYDENEVGVGD